MDKEFDKLTHKLNRLIDAIYPAKIDYSEIIANFNFFSWRKGLVANYLKEIKNPYIVDLDDIIALDYFKETILNNTFQFCRGYLANNILLWGERGCGKSSLIKSIVKKFENYKLKLIEVKSDSLNSLEQLFDIIANYSDIRFIVFLDDISYTVEDTGYRILKSLLDGSLTENMNNFLIYATSNRRHMVKEEFSDKEIHEFEAISEKVSLSDRFGISLGVYKPLKEDYISIVENYVIKFNLQEFFNKQDALNWAMNRGGFSGRTAYHYVLSLFFQLAKKSSNSNN